MECEKVTLEVLVVIGLVGSIVSNGFDPMGLGTVWAGSVACLVLAIAGLGFGVFVLARLFKEARHDPYDFAVPLLSVLSALILDLASEYEVGNGMLRMAITGVVAFFVIVAGACWKSGRQWKLVGSILIVGPVAGVLSQRLEFFQIDLLFHELLHVPGGVWIRLVGFLAIASVIAMISR